MRHDSVATTIENAAIQLALWGWCNYQGHVINEDRGAELAHLFKRRQDQRDHRIPLPSPYIHIPQPLQECLECKQQKTLTNFNWHVDNTMKTGFKSICKVCICRKNRTEYQQNSA